MLAWDLERIGYLARLFHNIGYIDEKETWVWIKKSAEKTKETFTTWEDYILSLLIGRGFAMGADLLPFEVAHDLLTQRKDFLDANPLSNF